MLDRYDLIDDVPRTEASPPILSKEDKANLASLDRKLTVVRDYLNGLIHGYHTGLWVYGDGGLGKSYTVLKYLEDEGHEFILCNSRMTGRGLFDKLCDCPCGLFVIEDCESLLRDRLAHGVLRSALWSQSSERPMRRPVTWSSKGHDLETTFEGAIVMIANCEPELCSAVIAAIKTRISVFKFEATRDEVEARMRAISIAGYKFGTEELNPAECMEVCETLIRKLRHMCKPPDLRILVNCFKDRLQHKNGQSMTPWERLADTRISENLDIKVSRVARARLFKEIALELSRMKLTTCQRFIEWERRTGRKKDAYYAALKR